MNLVTKFFGLLALIIMIFFAYSYVFWVCWNNGVALALGLKEIEFSTSAWMMALFLFFRIATAKIPQKIDP